MSEQNVRLCVHYDLDNFEGQVKFDASDCVRIRMDGTFKYIDRAKPIEVDIKLPQKKDLPWWFIAYIYACPGVTNRLCNDQPYVTLETEGPPLDITLAQINCNAWTVALPGVPLHINIETLCGMLPLHFVIRQRAVVYGTFVLQQIKRCTRIGH